MPSGVGSRIVADKPGNIESFAAIVPTTQTHQNVCQFVPNKPKAHLQSIKEANQILYDTPKEQTSFLSDDEPYGDGEAVG